MPSNERPQVAISNVTWLFSDRILDGVRGCYWYIGTLPQPKMPVYPPYDGSSRRRRYWKKVKER